MIRAYIKDPQTSSLQLALMREWIDEELLMRELQFRSDHQLWHYEERG
jgi:hypothetical protein